MKPPETHQQDGGLPLSTSDLLADLILIQCGWRTESEHERYLAANSRIMKAGRKIHLQAELDSLG